MIQLGKIQELEIVKTTDNGVYLAESAGNVTDAEPSPADLTIDRVLLPRNQAPKQPQLGMKLSVFIYKDSEDRPIATTTVPPLTLGQVAMLPVKEVSKIGAFLSWGLAKDLLLPFKEQTSRVKEGDSVLVALYIDKSQRLCATTKVYEYLKKDSHYKVNDKVSGTVYEVIDSFGAFVAIDNRYSALIPKRELFAPLKAGDFIEARVSTVHPDGKIDLSLREQGYLQLDTDAEAIYQKLCQSGGFLPFHDKSEPDEIKAAFSLSKNAFKRAIGRLMKEGKITISNSGIKAVGMDSSTASYTRS